MRQERICCIYRITSKVHPDRIYIGSTVDFYERRRKHLYDLKKNRHKNIKVQSHFDKYGVDDLTFEIIEIIEANSRAELITREQYYLDTLHPYLNISPTADRPLNVERSEETKRKIGDASRGHKMPQHVLDLLVSINKGGHITEEHKKAISKAQSKPKPYMVERNKGNKFGEANKGKPSPFKGKKKKKTGVVPRSAFKKGSIPWNKGKKVRYISKPSQSISMKKYWAKRKEEERLKENGEEEKRD